MKPSPAGTTTAFHSGSAMDDQSQPITSADQPQRRSSLVMTLTWIYDRLDFVVGILLVAGISIAILAIPRAPIVVGAINFIDQSWLLDLVFKTRQGVWLGRDVAFTYGPIAQLLWGLSSRIHGLSLGSAFKYVEFLPFLYVVIADIALAFLLLRGHPAWKRAFYILALVVFWQYFDFRVSTALLLFAISLYHFDKVLNPGSKTLWRSVLVALPLAASFLVSTDTGVYAVIGFGLVAGSQLICFRADRLALKKILQFAFLTGAFLVVWMFLIGAVITRSFSMQFWTISLANIENYRWSVAFPMVRMKAQFVSTFIVSGVIAILAWIWRDPGARSISRKPVFVLSAYAFSFLFLQSSIVRADRGHVAFGLSPAIALSAVILMGSEKRSRIPWWDDGPVFLALAMTALFTGPTPMLVPKTLAADIQRYRAPETHTCPSNTFYLDGACLSSRDFSQLNAVSNYIDSHSAPSDSVFIFPYENVYAVTAKRVAAGGVLQNYAAMGNVLIQHQIASLEAQKPPLAIYSADGLASGPVDGVPNLTRTPEIWLYLQAHYRTESQVRAGVLVLRRDDTRHNNWAMDSTELPINSVSRPIDLRHADEVTVSDHILWPADADLLKISLLLDYPLSWHLRKPWQLLVEVHRADGTEKIVPAIVPPGRLSEIWIYPWMEQQLKNYFSSSTAEWRLNGSRSPVTELRIKVKRMDWISVRPLNIRIDKLQAVKLSLRSTPSAGTDVTTY